MRSKFIVDMYKELKAEQNEVISNQQLRGMINDIRVFLRNSEEEYKTN